MTIDHAFMLFKLQATARGLTDISEPQNPSAAAIRSVNVNSQDGVLRIAFNGEDEVILLAINHGPTDNPTLFWLDLYQASCQDGQVLATEQEDVSFESALEYGFDLLRPGHGEEVA